jgi:hypothetical protein
MKWLNQTHTSLNHMTFININNFFMHSWYIKTITTICPRGYSLNKSCPTTCHRGAWGERRYSSYSFLTSALDGCEQSASHPSSALPLGKGPPVPTEQEAGWAPEPVWMQGLEEKPSARQGSNPGCPACSQTLYCLSDRGSYIVNMQDMKINHIKERK